MPHRLRRVIGVNIRNPRDGGTSMRIAQIDTRGAVVAVGQNGVGKTSFLRLIPVFYGALPSRVLRGSGHTHMIRYVLPHPSSAVVYEYERESERDVRCVVMYPAPEADQDAPVFYILRAAFEDRLFTAPDGTFLTRDEFKPHIEALGVHMTQQLSLSEYRSVILNTGSLAKNALRLKHMAAEHSLAPGSLRGLDQIAAAMGPEAISFQALQEIVVDQVAQELTGEGGSMTKELRKSSEDVAKWLEAFEHQAKLMARTAESEQLVAQCKVLEAKDNSLREVRAAVVSLSATLQERALDLQRLHGTVETEGAAKGDELNRAMEEAKEGLRQARQLATVAEQQLEQVQSKTRYYETLHGMGAQKLDEQVQLESSLQADLAHQKIDLQELSARASGIVGDFNLRRSAIDKERDDALIALGTAATAASQSYTDRLEKIRLAQEEAAGQLTEPPRLSAARSEREALTGDLGEAKGALRNPAAESATLSQIAEVDGKRKEATGLARKAEAEVGEARVVESRAAKAQREAQIALDEAETTVGGLQEDLRNRELQLQPPTGTLLAHIRASTAPDRSLIARVLDHRLVQRTDLAPEEIQPADAGPNILAVGSLALRLADVQDPEWLDAGALRNHIARLQEQLKEKVHHQDDARSAAAKANGDAERARKGLAAAEGRLKARREDTSRLEAQLDDLGRQAAAQVKQASEDLHDQVLGLSRRVNALSTEIVNLELEVRDAVLAIAERFGKERGAAELEQKATHVRIKIDKEAAVRRAKERHAALTAEEAKELSAAQVDPLKLESLRNSISMLEVKLQNIADWKPDVLAWRKFRDGPRLQLQTLKETSTNAIAARDAAGEASKKAEEQARVHAAQVLSDLEALEHERKTAEDDRMTLQQLLGRELVHIGEPRFGTAVQSWTVEGLLMEVSQLRRDLGDAKTKADTLAAGLRNLMRSREGPAYDWITRQEADLREPEGLADHLASLGRARLICQWWEGPADDAAHVLNLELHGVLAVASSFVDSLDKFAAEVGKCNHQLQSELSRISPFPSFQDLGVHIRSTVNELHYMNDLRRMKDLGQSRVSLRGTASRQARHTQLPDPETVGLMRSFRDLLGREGNLRANLSDLVRLECSITINGKRHRIASSDEFRTHASNGNTGMIIGMFLMGFAGVVRRNARAAVRVTWITDEAGRFDAPNLQQFLRTLDQNNIDVISAQPEASPATLDLYDTESRFSSSGRISTTRVGVDDWDSIATTVTALKKPAHVQA